MELNEERYQLVMERISGITEEETVQEPYRDYFRIVASFIGEIKDYMEALQSGELQKAPEKTWQEYNRRLYADMIGERYESCYANPAFAARVFGPEASDYARLLSFLYAEIRGMIPYASEGNKEAVTILAELFVEVYCKFEGEIPPYAGLREIVYWYAWDYLDFFTRRRVREQVDPELDFAERILEEADRRARSGNEDLSYLYYYGEYIDDAVRAGAAFVNHLPEGEIKRMADAYVNGYILGFKREKKDLSRKKTVNIRYQMGFERVVAEAVRGFKAAGLRPVIYRAAVGIHTKRGMSKVGYYGAAPNRQYEYDHRQDQAIFLDKRYVNRKLEILRQSFEEFKTPAREMAGPAVIETFGEMPFAPEAKSAAAVLNERQRERMVYYESQASLITNEYIPGEERSFTIISFPTPEIGKAYPEIFRDVIQINTLDYKKYEEVQQKLINALDRGLAAEIIGRGKNHTRLTVAFTPLSDPERETIFENCVADVNIPVGEVFTSPRLKGTNGILHVTGVFLEGLFYKDLELTFTDGMVTDYSCGNFETEEENRKYIFENLLQNHESLPLGEFAIGTNTFAYVMAEKYHIQDRMPILIAEKMGPHFAVGDTCYSHEEDLKVYNSDGKEIIARENTCSAKRKENPDQAYFQCHTDITIPYSELGEINALSAEGGKITLIRDGRFVLEGTGFLNEPFSKVEEESFLL